MKVFCTSPFYIIASPEGAWQSLVKSLFYMCVIADMIFAVAKISVALGTIAKFQFWIAHIGSAADGASMGIGSSLFRSGLPKGNRTGVPGSSFFSFSLGDAQTPSRGKHIDQIPTAENEIVQKSYQREQVVGEVA